MPKKTKPKEEKKPETVTLTKDQFDTLLGEIVSLKEQVQELSERPSSGKPPVFYSGGDPNAIKDLLQEEKKEKILSGDTMRRAVDMAIKDYKQNPPRRY